MHLLCRHMNYSTQTCILSLGQYWTTNGEYHNLLSFLFLVGATTKSYLGSMYNLFLSPFRLTVSTANHESVWPPSSPTRVFIPLYVVQEIIVRQGLAILVIWHPSPLDHLVPRGSTTVARSIGGRVEHFAALMLSVSGSMVNRLWIRDGGWGNGARSWGLSRASPLVTGLFLTFPAPSPIGARGPSRVVRYTPRFLPSSSCVFSRTRRGYGARGLQLVTGVLPVSSTSLWLRHVLQIEWCLQQIEDLLVKLFIDKGVTVVPGRAVALGLPGFPGLPAVPLRSFPGLGSCLFLLYYLIPLPVTRFLVSFSLLL